MDHPALLYSSLPRFVDEVVPFVREGIERGEPVVVAVGDSELAALRKELGPDRPGMELADTRRWHPHPASRLRAFHGIALEAMEQGARRVRLVGEPAWPTGPPEFVQEWERYESVLNRVLGPLPVTLICTYDTTRTAPAILDHAQVTHPTVDGDPSARYVRPDEVLARWNDPLSDPPEDADLLERPASLPEVRRFVRDAASRAGVAPDRVTDLCIAANEVVTNAEIHGGEPITLRVWTDGDRFLCQVDDAGKRTIDPLAGYLPPSGRGDSGRGLWLARQLVDLLQVVPRPGGTSVRLHVFRA
ncbi:MAG TPA: sensor histidine kinase [Actinomycetota bacterium]|nr:sensor histidine kinase [Actinomycetota bacterium]